MRVEKNLIRFIQDRVFLTVRRFTEFIKICAQKVSELNKLKQCEVERNLHSRSEVIVSLKIHRKAGGLN